MMPHHNRRKGDGVLARARLVFLVFFIAAAAWTVGFVRFVDAIPRTGNDAETGAEIIHTDAIVVLTGGSQRLTTGLSLLESGAGEKLFVSGVYDGVEVRELLSAWSKAPSDLADRVVLGYSADSTVGNAVETSMWMREQNYRSLRLVTANYHMQRSLLEFRLAMPDAVVVPHPVTPAAVRLDDWWKWRGSASLLAGEYTKYLAVRLRYWIETTLAPASSSVDGSAR